MRGRAGKAATRRAARPCGLAVTTKNNARLPDASWPHRSLTYPDQWGERILARFPLDLQRQARGRWQQVANTGPKYPGLRHEGVDALAPHALANRELAMLARELDQIKFGVATSDADIVEAAYKLASLCDRRNFSGERIAEHFGIELTWPRSVTADGIQRRFCDPRWWRRKLRATIGRAIEETMRKRALVRRGAAVYLTDWSLRRWRGQRSAARVMLENSVAINEEGEQLELIDIADASVSNPELRRGEMMLRARGFEEQAREHGYTWTFATLTCPSVMHPQLHKGGDNPRYNGSTVRQAQRWLCDRWERSRAALHRERIAIFGFRVAEPHHDGTPHWHALLFVRPVDIDRLEEILRAEWLSDHSDESGASKFRVRFEREQAGRPGSSAAGYIAKYIGKNVDGHGVDGDYEAQLDGAEGAERAVAWASIHGIRQFQQLGGPQVGIWRELRRLRDPVQAPEIEAARVATDKPASWARFIDAQGGLEAGRKGAVRLWKQLPLDLENRYGEQRAPVVQGVQSMRRHVHVEHKPYKRIKSRCRVRYVETWEVLERIKTRLHVWRIERKNPSVKCGDGRMWDREARAGNRLRGETRASELSSLGPVSITVRGSNYMPAAEAPSPDRFSGGRGVGWMN